MTAATANEAGTQAIDQTVASLRKLGVELVPWTSRAVDEIRDLPLSLETLEPAATEAGLEVRDRPASLKNVRRA